MAASLFCSTVVYAAAPTFSRLSHWAPKQSCWDARTYGGWPSPANRASATSSSTFSLTSISPSRLAATPRAACWTPPPLPQRPDRATPTFPQHPKGSHARIISRQHSRRCCYGQDQTVHNLCSESTWRSRRDREDPWERESKYSRSPGNRPGHGGYGANCGGRCAAREEGAGRSEARVRGNSCGRVRAAE